MKYIEEEEVEKYDRMFFRVKELFDDVCYDSRNLEGLEGLEKVLLEYQKEKQGKGGKK